jgi:hypothetical protein
MTPSRASRRLSATPGKLTVDGMMARNVSRASAAFVIVGITAMGCSHAWDVLEPLPGSTGTGGGATASGTGGLGGAGATSTTSSAGGAGGATSTTSSAQGTGGSATSAQSSSADASSAAASSADASSAAASSSSGTGGGGSTAYYGATFGACNSNQDLNLANCEALAGPNGMYTDVLSDTGLPMHAYVRFDLDAQLAGKTIDAVTLRLTTLPGNSADSVSSGEIWQVMPFDAASLPLGQPATIGGVIGMDLGAVALATDYYWGLPSGLVAANAPVFLGIISLSDDGVRYWNDHGVTPPLLIVNYH